MANRANKEGIVKFTPKPESKASQIRKDVFQMMRDGVWRGHISEVELSEKYDTNQQYVNNYAVAVGQAFAMHLEKDLPLLRSRLLTGIDDIRIKATQKGNYVAALKAFELIAKITGANAPEQIVVNGKDPKEMSDDELDDKIARLTLVKSK